jgi:hypothetical protein
MEKVKAQIKEMLKAQEVRVWQSKMSYYATALIEGREKHFIAQSEAGLVEKVNQCIINMQPDEAMALEARKGGIMLTICNIEYAPASAIIAEVEALRKANAPESVVSVLIGVLNERKEKAEKELRLTEKALSKVFQTNFYHSLLENYKYHQSELEEICNYTK